MRKQAECEFFDACRQFRLCSYHICKSQFPKPDRGYPKGTFAARASVHWRLRQLQLCAQCLSNTSNAQSRLAGQPLCAFRLREPAARFPFPQLRRRE
jgi:hypothetical protein